MSLKHVMFEPNLLGLVIFGVLFKAHKLQPGLQGGDTAAPAAQVRVQYPVSGLGETLEDPGIQGNGLLRRVDAVCLVGG